MENPDKYKDIQNYKIFIQTFDPTSKVDLSHEDYYYITFAKIGVFEKGFNLTKKKKL